MFSTHIRFEPSGVARASYNLTRDQAYANARWAMANAYLVTVTDSKGTEYIWSRRTCKWTTRRVTIG